MNILILEDDILFAESLKRCFNKKIMINRIHLLHSFYDFQKELFNIGAYDMILLDIHFIWEKQNGIDVVNLIRSKDISVPIVIISSYGDINFLDTAFKAWVNDYMIKPIRFKELEIRVFRWFRNYCYSLFFGTHWEVSYNEISYSFDKNTFYFLWREMKLSKKNKYILFLLLVNARKLVSEEYLQQKIWWDRDGFKQRNIRVYILRLKNDLKKYGW